MKKEDQVGKWCKYLGNSKISYSNVIFFYVFICSESWGPGDWLLTFFSCTKLCALAVWLAGCVKILNSHFRHCRGEGSNQQCWMLLKADQTPLSVKQEIGAFLEFLYCSDNSINVFTDSSQCGNTLNESHMCSTPTSSARDERVSNFHRGMRRRCLLLAWCSSID